MKIPPLNGLDKKQYLRQKIYSLKFELLEHQELLKELEEEDNK